MNTDRDDPTLLDAVTATVARVFLQKTGRCRRPAPADDLFGRGGLDEFDTATIALALAQDFDVELDPTDVNRRTLRSVEAIAELLARRRRS